MFIYFSLSLTSLCNGLRIDKLHSILGRAKPLGIFTKLITAVKQSPGNRRNFFGPITFELKLRLGLLTQTQPRVVLPHDPG